MVWRIWPRQIASDLQRFFHLDIADWHQGRMSSYKLLELFGASVTEDEQTRTRTIDVEFPPEQGALARALRGGCWPIWQQMMAETVNEAYRFRSSYHTVNGGAEASFDTSELEFIDPAVQAARERFAEAVAEERRQEQQDFESEIGFS